ncbi:MULTISPECIES: hypothetical protein [unclassified Streptomyces]|uniref:hypothetical protein n=1 Tax=unclassified Streptomyces TaxID=2593676 RepID=UPI0036E71648
MTRQHFDHSQCSHDKTKAGRAACRKTMRAEALGETTDQKAATPVAAKKAPAKPATPAKKSPVRATAAKKATPAPAKAVEPKADDTAK